MCFGLVVDHVDQVDDDEQVYAWNGEVVVLDGESARALGWMDGWIDSNIRCSKHEEEEVTQRRRRRRRRR